MTINETRMKAIIRAVIRHWRVYGVPPSTHWLMNETGISSTSMIVFYTDRLVKDGQLIRTGSAGQAQKLITPFLFDKIKEVLREQKD